MNNCSICGFGVAWCVDKEDKGTYWLCGRCAVEDLAEKIVRERVLVRVARAAKDYDEGFDAKILTMEDAVQLGRELKAALKEAENCYGSFLG